jgi:hypothetical protein
MLLDVSLSSCCAGLAEDFPRCVAWLLLCTCRKQAPRAVSDGSASLMPEYPSRSPRPPATSTNAASPAACTPGRKRRPFGLWHSR